MIKALILTSILLLGVCVVRFIIGAVGIIVTGKYNKAPITPWLRWSNLLETIGIVTAYVVLVVNYYC